MVLPGSSLRNRISLGHFQSCRCRLQWSRRVSSVRQQVDPTPSRIDQDETPFVQVTPLIDGVILEEKPAVFIGRYQFVSPEREKGVRSPREMEPGIDGIFRHK